MTWTDPRTRPRAPFRGPARPLAEDPAEIEPLISACRAGRLYDVELWIQRGRPLQLDPRKLRRGVRRLTPLSIAISAGSFDLVHLLLCNGYRCELETRSPLDDVLEMRRWDLLDLLLDWGADPATADTSTVLDTYQTSVFERFWSAGVDLAGDGTLAGTLASATRNRPLYGFVKNHRQKDPRLQRALDAALGAAIEKENDKAVALCLWAGADPRRCVGDPYDDPDEDEHGYTGIERAVVKDLPKYLSKLGFDPEIDSLEALYGSVRGLNALRALVRIRPPKDWHRVTERFLDNYCFSVRFNLYWTGFYEVVQVFELGGRLGPLDRHFKRELRRLLLTLGDYDAKRLFRLLRNPENMDRAAFVDLIGHDKLAARYADWPPYWGIDKSLVRDLAAASGVPASVRRLAKTRLSPPRRIETHTTIEDAEGPRVVSREELYEMVWSEPMLTLAKRLGLSDNGLRKRCKAMAVPTPPRGYWQKLGQGRKLRRPSLPPIR